MATNNASTVDVNDAMHAWLRACANPRRASDVAAAVCAGLLQPGEAEGRHRYVATLEGRKWLIANAIANGATEAEAHAGIELIDGA